MARMRLDPFSPVEAKLEELRCDRAKLRPEGAIRSWRRPNDPPDAFEEEARGRAERLAPGACRKAFESLFGLEKPDAASSDAVH